LDTFKCFVCKKDGVVKMKTGEGFDFQYPNGNILHVVRVKGGYEFWTEEKQDEKDKARHRCNFEGEPGAPFDENLDTQSEQ